jgi:hypothetical protein
MAKLSKGDTSSTEVHPDAWARFERAVDVVAKSPPQHRVKGGIPKHPKGQSRRKLRGALPSETRRDKGKSP